MPRKTLVPLLSLSIASSIFVRGELPGYPLTFGEMKVLAGYYTADGKYRGGLPEAAKQERHGAYQCLGKESSSASPTACMEYTVEGGVFGLGLCECKETAASGEHCSTWMCNSNSNSESTLCRCVVEGTSGLFCDSWSCTGADSDGVKGHGDYECKRESSSGHYCEAWNGKSTPESGVVGEVAVAACECEAESKGDRVCSFWKCQEVAIEEFVGDWTVVVILSVSISAFIAYLCHSAVTETDKRILLWMLAGPGVLFVPFAMYNVLVNGGVDGGTLLGIMCSVPIVLAFGYKVSERRSIRRREI